MLARFALACQTNTIAGIHARRDFNGQSFTLFNTPMTVAFMARIFDQRTASLTVWAGLLYSKESLAHLYLTRTMTGRTGLRLRASFRAAAVANVALLQRRNTDLFGHATHRFFQGEIHVITQISPTRRTLATTPAAKDIAKNVTKDITEISAAIKAAAKSAAHTALFKRGVTILIVGCAFLRIGQHFIGFFNLFKFSFGLFITLIAVRMIFHGQALIRLFDFTLFRCFGNA